MDHTVLQSIDRQPVARTHLFHNAAYHLQSIYIDYQLFATESGYLFSPPSVVSLNLNAYMLDLPLKEGGSPQCGESQYITKQYVLYGSYCFAIT